METNNNFNPFCDTGIANYNQYKQYKFIKFRTHETLTNRIKQQISQINNNIFFGERLILIADRGLGKTSTLYYLKDLLQSDGIKTYLLNVLASDVESFIQNINNCMSEAEKFKTKYASLYSFKYESIYVLIDFPDASPTHYRNFLEFLWHAISHENQDKLNFIIAMNQPHYDKSFGYSQILGKFVKQMLERLDIDETKELVQSRLNLIHKDIFDIFSEGAINVIQDFSKGVPRNIISGCSLLFDQGMFPISTSQARRTLKETYYPQIIKERVEDPSLRAEYNLIVNLLEKSYSGRAASKMELMAEIQKMVNIGQVSASRRIDDLQRFGIVNIVRGGHNRLNKIVTLVE